MADLHQGTFNSFCRIYQTAKQMQYAVHVLFLLEKWFGWKVDGMGLGDYSLLPLFA
jgi:hypothetical protein